MRCSPAFFCRLLKVKDKLMTKRLILLTVLLLAVLYAAGTWTQEGAKLVGSGATTNSYSGPVSLSYDGKTAALIATNEARAWVYTYSAGVWSQKASLSYMGTAVALSGDGNTLAK